MHALLKSNIIARLSASACWQVGRVEEVYKVPDSDKLLRCIVDLGPAGKRQV